MGNCFSAKSVGNGSHQPSYPINFKIKPYKIPATEVQKLGLYPNGSGGLGDVWMCSWSPQSQDGTSKVAVKLVRVPQADDTELVNKTSKRIRREAYVWIKLEHENILPFNGVVDGFGILPALVSPWMENGSLDNYLTKGFVLSEADKLRMLRQMAAGLNYLHEKGVVHGDLTCTNVLISADQRLYLADFGLSVILSETQNSTFNSYHQGNVRWMAPEMFAMPDQGGVVMPTKAADVYSYGCIMLQLFCGRVPYLWLTKAHHIIAARVAGTEPFRHFSDIEDVYKDFALRCISVNFDDRPVASAIVEFLGVE